MTFCWSLRAKVVFIQASPYFNYNVLVMYKGYGSYREVSMVALLEKSFQKYTCKSFLIQLVEQ